MLKKSHRQSIATTAALLALLAGAPTAALACNAEPYIGSVCTFAFDWCPQDYMKADGSPLPTNQYAALYSLIGNLYGGNSTTFNLPDLRGRVAVATGLGANLSNVVIASKRGAEAVTLSTNQIAPHIHAAATVATVAAGNLNLPLSGSTSNVPVTGTVSANVLTTQTTGSGTTPSATVNTVGKNGLQANFYPYSAGATVATPSTISLTASGGTLTGNATGAATLPVAATTVNVQPNPTASLPVPVINPSLGLTACIAVNGLYPTRP